jgi:hypothetical protein
MKLADDNCSEIGYIDQKLKNLDLPSDVIPVRL